MTLVFPRVRSRQKRRPFGRRFCLPLLRRTPVGIDPERIAGLLPAAPAVPRQTGGAQQGGSGIERHAGVRGLGAGAAAAGRGGIVVAAGGGGSDLSGRRDRFNIGKTQISVCGGNRSHCVPVHRSGDFSGEVIFSFRHQQNGIHIFFPAFKRCNGRQGAVYLVVGMPYSNGLIVFI